MTTTPNTQVPSTTNGRRIQKGYTFDPECHRASHRLSLAAHILSHAGVEATTVHAHGAGNEGAYGRHVCDYHCEVVWPEWVTGETFDHAYALANEIQTARGEFHRAEAYAAKAAREAAARVEVSA